MPAGCLQDAVLEPGKAALGHQSPQQASGSMTYAEATVGPGDTSERESVRKVPAPGPGPHQPPGPDFLER